MAAARGFPRKWLLEGSDNGHEISTTAQRSADNQRNIVEFKLLGNNGLSAPDVLITDPEQVMFYVLFSIPDDLHTFFIQYPGFDPEAMPLAFPD